MKFKWYLIFYYYKDKSTQNYVNDYYFNDKMKNKF